MRMRSTGKWGEEMIGWEKGRGDKDEKGRTRNQANVNGRRMSMILLRLSIDSPLRASDGGKGQVPTKACTITETHLVKSYAKKAQRRGRCTCPRWAKRLDRDTDVQ